MLFKKSTQEEAPKPPVPPVVPTGSLKRLTVDQIKPSTNNPRHLFDPAPLLSLKENIREHGVLVPITVYQPKGQEKYSILDGERRFRSCLQLQHEGHKTRSGDPIDIPANVVDPPDKVAGLVYMFSIHNFREAWELMPMALALENIMEETGERENRDLRVLTGVSEPQIERCKILLTFPKRFQDLSLDSNPKTRIPSNAVSSIYIGSNIIFYQRVRIFAPSKLLM
jgi:ParB/RepB/Spo0J family partition protein